MSKSNGLMSPSVLVTMMYECEAKGLAEWNEEYTMEATPSMRLGSFVDALSQGDKVYRAHLVAHPEICKKGGELRSEYVKAYEDWQDVSQRDPIYMSYLQGEAQTHLVGEIDGIPFHGYTDFMTDDFITDLKYTRNIQPEWNGTSWARSRHHDIRMAIYHELALQMDGKDRKCYLAPLTKETPYDHDILELSPLTLSDAMDEVHKYIPRLKAILSGEIQPDRCGHCEYCRATKLVTVPRDSEAVE